MSDQRNTVFRQEGQIWTTPDKAHLEEGAQKWMVNGPAGCAATALSGCVAAAVDLLIAESIGLRPTALAPRQTPSTPNCRVSASTSAAPFGSVSILYATARRSWFACAATLKEWQLQQNGTQSRAVSGILSTVGVHGQTQVVPLTRRADGCAAEPSKRSG